MWGSRHQQVAPNCLADRGQGGLGPVPCWTLFSLLQPPGKAASCARSEAGAISGWGLSIQALPPKPSSTPTAQATSFPTAYLGFCIASISSLLHWKSDYCHASLLLPIFTDALSPLGWDPYSLAYLTATVYFPSHILPIYSIQIKLFLKCTCVCAFAQGHSLTKISLPQSSLYLSAPAHFKPYLYGCLLYEALPTPIPCMVAGSCLCVPKILIISRNAHHIPSYNMFISLYVSYLLEYWSVNSWR